MKPSKFLSQRLIDKLVQPLLETYKLMFLTMNYDLSERQVIELQNNNEFNEVFEICIRDSLKDYQNTTIELKDLYNDIKFNIGVVYNWLDSYLERKCID